MGIRQTVRHRILIPAFTGSIPVCPAHVGIVQQLIYLTFSLGYEFDFYYLLFAFVVELADTLDSNSSS